MELLGVAKEYLGPAAPAFLSRELHALGVNANNVQRIHLLQLAERARLAAGKVMDNKKASEVAQALAQRGSSVSRSRSRRSTLRPIDASPRPLRTRAT